MEISEHAIIRHLQRSNQLEKIKTKIMNIMRDGNTVQVTPANEVSHSISNKYRQTGCLLCKSNSLVYLFRQNTVVTVLRYKKSEWKETKGISEVANIYAPEEHHHKIRQFVSELKGGMS